MKAISTFLSAFALGLTACAHGAKSSQSHYDTVPPAITEWMKTPSVLVFSKTNGWRHNEGIAGANRFFADLTSARDYGLFTTENGAVFNAGDLARFEIVVFNNVTGDVLSPDQKAAFEDWLESGGAWIGLHGSGDSSHTSWPWYDKHVIGPEFIGHPADPQFQKATLISLNAEHPILRGLPERWEKIDEWYSFDGLPQDYGLIPLIGLDENTYKPRNDVYGDVSDLRMGSEPDDHPVVWAGTIGEGRIFYSAIGHNHESYDHPVNRLLLSNAFDWITSP